MTARRFARGFFLFLGERTAEPVNHNFLSHVFTPRLGWVLAVALLLGSSGCLAGNHLFAPAAIAKPRALAAEELMPIFGDFASVELTLPLTFGFLNPALATTPCAEGSRAWLSIDASGTGQSCIELPSEQGGWIHLTTGGPEIAYDTWHPLFLFRPSVHVDTLEEGVRPILQEVRGYRVAADPDTWIVLSVYASRTPLGETGPLPAAPTVPDVIRQYPWLYRL